MSVIITPARGDIYYVHIPTEQREGSEFFGAHLHLVVSDDQINRSKLGIVLVVPLTSPTSKETGMPKDQGTYRHHRIRIGPGLIQWEEPYKERYEGESLVLTEQAFALSTTRLTTSRAGVLSTKGLAAVEAGLAFVFRIPSRSTTLYQREKHGPVVPPMMKRLQ